MFSVHKMVDTEQDHHKMKEEEAELTHKMVKIENMMDQMNQKMGDLKASDIVAFVGPTKSGKSTLINCLMDNPMECIQDPETEVTHIKSTEAARGPIIGLGGHSETSVPEQFCSLPGTGFPMWDFPGLGDNKGTEQEIANAVAYEKVLRPQNSVKFVVVVPVDLIRSDDPMPFYKLLNDVVLFSPNYKDNVCIVVTKSERGAASAWLRRSKDSIFDGANKTNSDIIANAKRMLDAILDKSYCTDFKAPRMAEGVLTQEFTVPNLEEIIELIKRLKGSCSGTMPLVISDQAKLEILELYTIMYRMLTKEFTNFKNCVDNYFETDKKRILNATDENGEPATADTQLANFKHGKSKVDELIASATDLQKILEALGTYGLNVQVLEERVARFQFAEKIQNMYKLEKCLPAQGVEEFFTGLKALLNEKARQYSELITNSANASENERQYEMKRFEHYNEQIRMLIKRNDDLTERNNALMDKYNSKSSCLIM